MIEQQAIVCSVCQKHRHELRPRKSKLKQGHTLYLCNACFAGKFEPKWLIVLIGRRDGIDAVKSYLIPKRYHGEEIQASDLVNL